MAWRGDLARIKGHGVLRVAKLNGGSASVVRSFQAAATIRTTAKITTTTTTAPTISTASNYDVPPRQPQLTGCTSCFISHIHTSAVRPKPTARAPWSVLAAATPQKRSLCARSGPDGDAESIDKLDVHVTRVDASNGPGSEKMMPEEDRKPLGEGVQKENGEPTTVRFMDVPGSEQTREEKMTVVFTCTVCDTRTAKTFAKLSYNKGVVIARCPGCHNLHLIADRLGWFQECGDAAGGWDIEKITNRIGEADCHVVNEDNVMELNLVDIAGKSNAQAPEAGDEIKASPPKTSGGSKCGTP